MKKQSKKPQARVVKELAAQFEAELNRSIQLAIQPDGSIVYKEYVVRQMKNENWGVYSIHSKDLIDQFFLRSCALMAAKAYNNNHIQQFKDIKQLDTRYWTNYTEHLVHSKNIKIIKEFDRFMISLNKLEHTRDKAEYYKEEISNMFKRAFV
jgi:flagellar biosynthesis regulator FlaF